MKTSQMIQLWGAYASKCMKATNGNLVATVRAMNLNNKHRVSFRIDDGKILLGNKLVFDANENNRAAFVQSEDDPYEYERIPSARELAFE